MDYTVDRHPSTMAIVKYFDYVHLRPDLVRFSEQCYTLAEFMFNNLPDSPELTVGLRKLLEAKDCFVRCALDLGESK